MADYATGNNNSASTAYNKGILSGGLSVYDSLTLDARYDNSLTTTGPDPVDYFSFTVPAGTTQISIRLQPELYSNGHDIAVYNYTLTGPGATRLSGTTSGVNASYYWQGNYTNDQQYEAQAVWAVQPGTYTVKVEIGTHGSAFLERGYHLYIDPVSVNSGGNTGGGNSSSGSYNSGIPDQDVSKSADNSVWTGLGKNDQLIFGAPHGNFTIQPLGGDEVRVIDNTGYYANYIFDGIEYISFADETVFVLNAERATIALLYSAALDRPPDVGGLIGWQNQYYANVPASARGDVYTALAATPLPGNNLSIAGNFTHSPEFINRYGALDDAGFVTRLYWNVLDRAPDSAGLNGWLSQMHGGQSREMVLVGFAASTENFQKATADWLIVA